jgi:WD40 repeat protein
MRLLPRSWPETWLLTTAASLFFSASLVPFIRFEPSLVLEAGDDPVDIIGFSPDGRMLATRPYWHLPIVGHASHGPVSLWDVSTHKQGVTIKRATKSEFSRVSGVLGDWADDSARRALYWICIQADTPDSRFRQFLSNSGLVPDDLADPTYSALSPDCKWVALAENRDQFVMKIVVRETATGRVLFRKSGCLKPAFSPDSKNVLIPEYEHAKVRVHEYDLESGRETRVSRQLLPPGGWSRLESNGRWWLALQRRSFSLGGQWIAVIDPWTGRIALPKNDPYDWKFLADGQRLVMTEGTKDREIHANLINLADGSKIRLAVAPMSILATSDDGRFAAFFEGRESDNRLFEPSAPKTGDVTVCDLRTGKRVATLPGDVGSLRYGRSIAAFSLDSRRIVVADANGQIRIWDLPLQQGWRGLLLGMAQQLARALAVLALLARAQRLRAA